MAVGIFKRSITVATVSILYHWIGFIYHCSYLERARQVEEAEFVILQSKGMAHGAVTNGTLCWLFVNLSLY
jgi:hypothetical protein